MSFGSAVAPLTRSVDWNKKKSKRFINSCCRSSHEERGLKLPCHLLYYVLICRSSHEERGLKCSDVASFGSCQCRSYHEERGLKFKTKTSEVLKGDVAPLTRSVDWNITTHSTLTLFMRRSSHEERGLKSVLKTKRSASSSGRSSHEERGLKFWEYNKKSWWYTSLLSRGAWIEISL